MLAITAVEQQNVALANQMAQLKVATGQTGPAGQVGQVQSATNDAAILTQQQWTDGQRALDASGELLHDLLIKSNSEHMAKAAAAQHQRPAATVTFDGNNSGMQTGVIHGGVTGITFGQ